MEQPNFTLAELAIWVTIFTSVTASLVASWKSIKEWVQAKWARAHTNEQIDVEKAKVKVTEKEAEIHEVQVLFSGYDALLTASTARAAAAETRAANAESMVTTLSGEIATIKRENNERLSSLEFGMQRLVNQKNEMIEHIQVLEKMVPTPPGPPVRPDWHLR